MANKERARTAYYLAVGTFAGIMTFALQDFVTGLAEDFLDAIGSLILTPLEALEAIFNNFVSQLGGLLIDFLVQPLAAFLQFALALPMVLTETILSLAPEGVDVDLPGTDDFLFVAEYGLEDPALAHAVDGPLGAPSITWGLVGIALIGVGASFAEATDIPIAGRVGGGVGSFFIVGGAMIAVWGFFPDISNYLLGGMFAVMFAIAMWTYTQVLTDAQDAGVGG